METNARRRLRATAGLVAAGFVAVIAMAGTTPAFADSTAVIHAPSTSVQSGPEIADYNGTSINLASGWGSATDCVVWHSAGIVKCFDSSTQLHAWQAQYAPGGSTPAAVTSAAVIPLVSCGTPLNLYADAGYRGRHLTFYDRGYWQNLTDYGFNDQMSAYIVGACSSHLAENTNGGGYWYPGNTGGGSAVTYVGAAWNDRVSSIYIN
jgi:hypothetical protein